MGLQSSALDQLFLNLSDAERDPKKGPSTVAGQRVLPTLGQVVSLWPDVPKSSYLLEVGSRSRLHCP